MFWFLTIGLPLYIVCGLVNVVAFSAFNSHQTLRRKTDPSYMGDYPFFLGAAASPMWPLVWLVGAAWFASHVGTGIGRGTGLHVNQTLARYKADADARGDVNARIASFLTANNLSLESVEGSTMRLLVEQVPEWVVDQIKSDLADGNTELGQLPEGTHLNLDKAVESHG